MRSSDLLYYRMDVLPGCGICVLKRLSLGRQSFLPLHGFKLENHGTLADYDTVVVTSYHREPRHIHITNHVA